MLYYSIEAETRRLQQICVHALRLRSGVCYTMAGIDLRGSTWLRKAMGYCPAETDVPRGSGSPEEGARASLGALALCLMRDSPVVEERNKECYTVHVIFCNYV